MALTIIMKVLAALTTVYSILIFIRVIMSWLDESITGGALDVLAVITDPYLDYFRRFGIFRTERFDFSPIAAIAFLTILNNIFVTIGYFGRISIGIILGMIVSALWSAAAFVLTFFAILVLVRLVVYLTMRDSLSPLWRTIDLMIRPVTNWIDRLIYRARIVSFRQSLITSFCALVAVRIIAGLLINLAVNGLENLPF